MEVVTRDSFLEIERVLGMNCEEREVLVGWGVVMVEFLRDGVASSRGWSGGGGFVFWVFGG